MNMNVVMSLDNPRALKNIANNPAMNDEYSRLSSVVWKYLKLMKATAKIMMRMIIPNIPPVITLIAETMS